MSHLRQAAFPINAITLSHCSLAATSTPEPYVMARGVAYCGAILYLTGLQGIYPVTNFMEMEEVVSIEARSNPGIRNILGRC
ncbi:MAG: hypothetical protein ABIN67_14325 [Ferruginibacter sp.]